MKLSYLPVVILVLVVMIASPTLALSRNLHPDAAARLLQQHDNLFLLDVRTPGEYQQARLAGARLIPISQLGRRLAEVPRQRPILVYCAVGSRSSQVVNFLTRQGYPDVYNLSGGIYAWAQRGHPILRGRP